MNDFLLIFMGIFILLLILLIFILLAYVYHTYTTYTIDINKNLETSETNINNTSNAFNKLQDNIVNELAKVNKNQETIIKTVPDNLNFLNSNLLDIFNLKDNDNKPINDITKSKIDVDSINIVRPFNSYKNIKVISDKDNYFTICNSKSGINNACVRMNIDDSDMFNIYTCNITKNNSNIKGINIYDSNNNVLASFDQFNRKILLGSGSDSTAAIKIIDNVYTPDVIICKYKCYPQVASATSTQINDAKTSASNTVSLIAPMLSALDTAITSMNPSTAKNNAIIAYNLADNKKRSATGTTITTVQDALNAINYAKDAYDAAKNAATIAISTAGISDINASLANIKNNIDTTFSNIEIANVVPSPPKIVLTIISNINIPITKYINLPIFNNFTTPITSTEANNITYLNNILKFTPAAAIQKNVITTITINITLSGTPATSMDEATTNGYI